MSHLTLAMRPHVTDTGDKGPRELNFGARFLCVCVCVILPKSYPRQQLVDVILDVFADIIAFCYSIFF